MNNILKQIALLERIDFLISQRATGTSIQLSKKLGISKTTLYRMITTMKELDAPITYNPMIQSFVYEKPCRFTFGFYEN